MQKKLNNSYKDQTRGLILDLMVDKSRNLTRSTGNRTTYMIHSPGAFKGFLCCSQFPKPGMVSPYTKMMGKKKNSEKHYKR